MSETSLDLTETLMTEGDMAKANADKLLADYGVPFTEAGLLIEKGKTIIVESEDDNANMKLARETRLALREHRIRIEKQHDILKADSLATGRAIDLVQRIALAEIKPVEEHLQLQEKYAETKQEERRQARIAERSVALSQYVDDLSIYNYGDMGDDAFAMLLDTVKTDKERREKEAEEAELARQAEQKRIEDERMAAQRKAEAAAATANKKAEKERAERKKVEDKLAIANAQRDRLEKAETDRLAAQQKADLKEEQRLARMVEARIAAEKAAVSAPDKEKLLLFVENVASLDIKEDTLSTKEGREIAARIAIHLSNAIESYRNVIEREL